MPLARSAFRVRDLPADSAIFASLAERTDFMNACARVRPEAPLRGVMRCPLPGTLLESLRAAADEAVAQYGLHGWLTDEGRSDDDAYLSLSLSHNPDLEEEGVADVHQATLGTRRTRRYRSTSYGETGGLKRVKHTYFDTYGFRLPTPAARTGALGRFLDECRLSPIRSRLSLLRGGAEHRYSFRFGWHRDEPVFENLRINIPLRSHGSFRLQIEHSREQPDRRSRSMTEHHLAPGAAYTFDTHRPHRVYARAACPSDRLHLVLGFAPWFRYDAATDSWTPNEFYGRVHPFDIVRSGALHPALRAADGD